MVKPAFDPNQPFTPVASAKPAFDPSQPFTPISGDSKMSGLDAAKIQGQAGVTLGLRPVVAGVGAAIGDLIGQYQAGQGGLSNGGKGYNLKEAKDAFVQGRAEANQEEKKANEDHPYISTAANVGGSLLTLPLLPAKGLSGAVKLGAGLGAAQAAGSANSLGEVAVDIGGSAGIGGVAYGAGKAISKGAQAISDSNVGQKIKDAVKKGLIATPSALTGVPDKEIEAYATQYDKVQKIISESGGNPSVAAEMQKENIQDAVKNTKSHLNSQISQALQNAPVDKTIPISSVIDKINSYKQRINPHLNPEALDQINQIQNRLVNASGTYGEKRTGGKVSVQDLQQIKQFLGDTAASAFNSSTLGFQVGTEAGNAAKQAYLESKSLMDKFGPEEIKNANRQLFQLHRIEERINKNLVVPGKSDAALYAIGSGAQNKDSLALDRLSQITGQNLTGDLSAMSAAKTFGAPISQKILPQYSTGKALAGPTAGAAFGGGLGGVFGGHEGAYMGAKIGGGIGAIVSSPAALQTAIDLGRISASALAKASRSFGVSPSNVPKLYEVLQSPQAQEILIKAIVDDNNNKAAASQNEGLGAMQRRAVQTR